MFTKRNEKYWSPPVCILFIFGNIFISHGTEVVVLAMVDKGGGGVLDSFLRLLQRFFRRYSQGFIFTLRFVKVIRSPPYLVVLIQPRKPSIIGNIIIIISDHKFYCLLYRDKEIQLELIVKLLYSEFLLIALPICQFL